MFKLLSMFAPTPSLSLKGEGAIVRGRKTSSECLTTLLKGSMQRNELFLSAYGVCCYGVTEVR